MTTQSQLNQDEVGRLIAADKVEGTAVYNLAGDKVGSVSNIMIDKISGRVAYAVLAAGGIENARLLLASNRVWRNGVGNAHDLVGRCFMEHLHVYDGLGSLAIWRDKLPQLYMPERASLF